VIPVVLGEPLREAPLRRVEVAAQPIVESGNLVTQLKEVEFEASLGVAPVVVALADADRGSALGARHVL
jgi:hypothetical protein